MKIKTIILYDEPTVPEIQIKKLQEFLQKTFPVKVEIRNLIFENISDETSYKIASTRIFELKKQFETHTPTTEQIQIEKENIDMSQNEEMILYDGYELQKIMSQLISENENNLETFHIVFTNKLTCTFDESDFRYHARALIGSNPAIISTSGIVEAPAKPKQYYLDLMGNFSEEQIEEINKKYKGQFLEYHDSRQAEIIEGYLLQAIFYYETGESFCDEKDCRLFNAHWQKDLFYSQLENKKLCQKHSAELENIKTS